MLIVVDGQFPVGEYGHLAFSNIYISNKTGKPVASFVLKLYEDVQTKAKVLVPELEEMLDVEMILNPNGNLLEEHQLPEEFQDSEKARRTMTAFLAGRADAVIYRALSKRR